jgi:hypothetical protein
VCVRVCVCVWKCETTDGKSNDLDLDLLHFCLLVTATTVIHQSPITFGPVCACACVPLCLLYCVVVLRLQLTVHEHEYEQERFGIIMYIILPRTPKFYTPAKHIIPLSISINPIPIHRTNEHTTTHRLSSLLLLCYIYSLPVTSFLLPCPCPSPGRVNIVIVFCS